MESGPEPVIESTTFCLGHVPNVDPQLDTNNLPKRFTDVGWESSAAIATVHGVLAYAFPAPGHHVTRPMCPVDAGSSTVVSAA